MIRGLQVTIGGDELGRRLVERIGMYEENIRTLDARIAARDGDLPFDVRADDGFETLADLKGRREHSASRLATLSLLRNSIVAEERYVLGKTDLQIAELLSRGYIDEGEIPISIVETKPTSVVDGLKLTFSGEELRERLTQRIATHQQRANWWQEEQQRTPEQQTEDHPLLPTHMCENEAEQHLWRADMLTFVREHLEPAAVYRLGEDDLSLGELLPEKPGWLQQQEYEERTNVGFQLERLTKRLGRLPDRRDGGPCANVLS